MTWGATSAGLYLLDVLITAKDSDSDSDSDVEDAVKARRKVRAKFNGKPTVGRCRLTGSTPVLKAPMVSALETVIS